MNTQLILRTGTKAQYESITVKDNDTLYFTTDTHEIFKGSVLYCETKVVENSPIFKDINGMLDLRHGKGLSNDNGVLTLNINSDDQYLKFDADKLTTKLPEYDDTTKNKVLAVKGDASGLEWSAISVNFIVTISYDGTDYSADKTMAEIWEAYNTNHMTIVLVYGDSLFHTQSITSTNLFSTNLFPDSDDGLTIKSFTLTESAISYRETLIPKYNSLY